MDCEGLPTGPELTVCQAARAAADAAASAQKLAAGNSWGDIVVDILGAVGALALPLLAFVVLFRGWPLLREIFETRKFTLKIGGFELSAQEATDQIRKQIEELQAQIVELKEAQLVPVPPVVAGDPFSMPRVFPAPIPVSLDIAPSPADLGHAARPPQAPPRAILWVDDVPSNNAFLIADFLDQGIKVDQATSTSEAMRRLAAEGQGYGVIISDFGREENGRYVPEAGAELARELRAMGSTTPMVIFSSARATRNRDRLFEAGANDVTSQSSVLRATVMRYLAGLTG